MLKAVDLEGIAILNHLQKYVILIVDVLVFNKDVILVGVGSRIEIWSKESWEESMSTEEINDIAEEMLGNGFEI